MGLYSHTTRAEGTVLTGFGSTSDIFNVDHLNHVIHTDPTFVNSWEDTLAHMNLETDPAPGGSLSLALAMSNEMERLRFSLTTIKKAVSGGTPPAHWYVPLGSVSEFQALPPTACRRTQTNAVDVNDNLAISYPWNSTVYDTASMTSNTGITAPVAGVYIVGGFLRFAGTLAHDFQLSLLRDTDFVASQQFQSGGSSVLKALSVETVVHFAKSQILTLRVFQNNTNNPLTGFETTTPGAALWMALVSRS